MRSLLILLVVLGLPFGAFAAGGHKSCGTVECDPVDIDLGDQASLQSGARIFVNYCLSCHSASYMRYNRMGRDLGISDELVKENLLFAADKVGDLMKAVMPKEDARQWFGVAPPDLSLIARSRKPAWVYTYMRSFYRDNKSPSGWNNTVFAHVAMPHVLYEWQGDQRAVFKKDEHGVAVFDRFEIERVGTMSPKEYDRAMRDLTNFLTYLGEPAKLVRYRIGIYVLIFLAVFLVFAYLLKKEYWKDIH
jgi:ubiquinol-cytochrome c reductase cytochrome c1 subunit